MRRRAIVIATAAAALACTAVDLGACGDKFLKVGQSTQVRRYAAIHRASILVYTPANATKAGVKFYEGLLKGAGHKPVVVKHGAAIAQVVAGGKYDLVIADYSDAATVKAQLQSILAKPDVLPILDGSSKALAAQAEKEYLFLIRPGSMTPFDALDEIEHAMERRLGGASSAPRTNKGH